MNRIIKYTLLVIMILMVIPSQAEASRPRLRTAQARARVMYLTQAIAQRARMPIQRVVKFTRSRICSRFCNR